MPDESTDLTGQQLGGFQLQEKIAEGGMGAVYKARQLSLGRIVAVKILPPRLAQDAQFVRRFQDEARAAANLKHPNLIQVHDAGYADGAHFFVMEYVEGETVAAKLLRDGAISQHLALGICNKVAQALQHAWDAGGLVHGDLKPENLILEHGSNALRVADLGLGKSAFSRTEESTPSESAPGMGTPAYVSPEQARGERKIDFRTDIYSLGATLYHMLTGKVPFEGLTPVEILAHHLQGHLPDPRTIRPGTSEATVVVLERMMAKEPSKRYPSWAALAHELSQVESGRSLALPALPPGQSTIQRTHSQTPAASAPAKKKKRVSPVRVTIELLLVAGIVAAVYWYVRVKPRPSAPAPPAAATATPAPATTPTNAVATPTLTVPPVTVATSNAPAIPVPAKTTTPTAVASLSTGVVSRMSSEIPEGLLPTKIAGLQLWLAADKGITKDPGNRVSAWGDQSGRGNEARQTNPDAQPLLVAQGINGRPVLRFDGVNDRLNFPPMGLSNFTVVIVFSMTAHQHWGGPIQDCPAGRQSFAVVCGGGGLPTYIPGLVRWDGKSEKEFASKKTATMWMAVPFRPTIHAWTSDRSFSHDGVEETVTDGYPSWIAKEASAIGYSFDYMAGDIAEALVYNNVLSSFDLLAVQQYLNVKYLITESGVLAMSPAMLAEIEKKRAANEAEARRLEADVRVRQLAEKTARELDARYESWRSFFGSLIANGELEKAGQAVAEARGKPQFATMKAKLDRDERIVGMVQRLRETAHKNLPGQTVVVGSASGVVTKTDGDKFWVKLSGGEVAMPLTRVEPAKFSAYALRKDPTDPDLNLAAGILTWFRGDKKLARTYFETAAKGGLDLAPYFPEAATPSAP